MWIEQLASMHVKCDLMRSCPVKRAHKAHDGGHPPAHAPEPASKAAGMWDCAVNTAGLLMELLVPVKVGYERKQSWPME